MRINSTGSNDVYLTDLTLNGFEEAQSPATGVSTVNSEQRTVNWQCTSNGVIIYGDVASITVSDMAGRQVAQSALSQFCNLASVPAGMYVVQAQMKDGSKVSTKIVRK